MCYIEKIISFFYIDSRRSIFSQANVAVMPKSSFKTLIPAVGRSQNINYVQRSLRTSPLIDCADFQRTILSSSKMRAPSGNVQYAFLGD